MKSIFSVIATAVMLFSALTACGRSAAGRVEEARTTPAPTAAAETMRPTATNTPGATAEPRTDRDDNDSLGDAIGDAANSAGNAVGDVIGGAGNAVGDAVEGVGDAVDDMVDNAAENGRITGSGTNGR